MTREMICIACPTGCRLTVSEEGGALQVTGNACPRGVKYGTSEFLNPVRTVTTLVRVSGGERPVVSVRTDGDVPKRDIDLVLQIARRTVVNAPIVGGDILVRDVVQGVNLVATADNKLKHK